MARPRSVGIVFGTLGVFLWVALNTLAYLHEMSGDWSPDMPQNAGPTWGTFLLGLPVFFGLPFLFGLLRGRGIDLLHRSISARTTTDTNHGQE